MMDFHQSDVLLGGELPYSALVDCGDYVHVSGVLAQDGADWQGRQGSIEEETAASLALIEELLKKVELALSDVVTVSIHMTDLSEFERMNSVYVRYFDPDRRPARTCVGVQSLLEGAKIEITVTARRKAAC